MWDEQSQGRDSHAPFPETSWSLVRGAQHGVDADRLWALNRLMDRYWRPLYAYYRSKNIAQQDAENLVQDFFCALIMEEKLTRMRSGVRFRHWLMSCARNFLIDQHRRSSAGIRQPPGGVHSLEDLKKTGPAYEPSDHSTPEEAFRKAWRRDLLQRAFEAVAAEARQANRVAELDIFLRYYTDNPEAAVSWKQLADKYQFEHWKQAKNKADWASRHIAAAIRAEIRKYVDTDTEVEEELQELYH